MDSSSSQKWSLLIPFITAPELPLKDSQTVILGDFHAELRPNAFNYSSLLVEDLQSEQAAIDLFESLRIGLLIASININFGVRVRDKAEILDHNAPMPNQVDVPLIYPTGKNLSRLVINRVLIQMQVGKIMPTLLQSLEFGIASLSARQAMADDRVKLATELYVDSYFETSDSAQFLGFVNVLEVLKDRDDASAAARGLVEKWRQESNRELDRHEAASITGSLRNLNWISISRGIGSVVRRHLGQDRVKEAQELYKARSSLVHDGIRPDNFSELVTVARKLTTELLARILLSGSL